jgi:hypothetical protein
MDLLICRKCSLETFCFGSNQFVAEWIFEKGGFLTKSIVTKSNPDAHASQCLGKFGMQGLAPVSGVSDTSNRNIKKALAGLPQNIGSPVVIGGSRQHKE